MQPLSFPCFIVENDYTGQRSEQFRRFGRSVTSFFVIVANGCIHIVLQNLMPESSIVVVVVVAWRGLLRGWLCWREKELRIEIRTVVIILVAIGVEMDDRITIKLTF